MRPDTVRTSLDIPKDLHQRLHEEAAKKGCSARQLILQSIERAVTSPGEPLPKHRLALDPPIVPSTGKAFDLSNEEVYGLIEFP